jgi:hypothetical protein
MDSVGNFVVGNDTTYSGTGVTSIKIQAASYPTLALYQGATNIGLLWAATDVALSAMGSRGIQFQTNDVTRVTVTAGGHFEPGTDNAVNCGASGKRWIAVHAVNGTIQTSDRTLKRNILTDTLGLDFLQKLRPVSFTMNGEAEDARRHGLIAQEVIDAADGQSLLGILTGDKDGEYGLNYAGFVPALIAAVQQQQQKIAALERQLHELASPK